jgi:uncharacterized protein YlaI
MLDVLRSYIMKNRPTNTYIGSRCESDMHTRIKLQRFLNPGRFLRVGQVVCELFLTRSVGPRVLQSLPVMIMIRYVI